MKYYFNKKWKSSYRTISRFMNDNKTWLDQEINLFKKKDIILSKKRKNPNKNTIKVNKFLKNNFDELISAAIKKMKKEGKHEAQKIFNWPATITMRALLIF